MAAAAESYRVCMPLRVMLTFPEVASCSQTTPPSFIPLLSTAVAALALVPLLRDPAAARAPAAAATCGAADGEDDAGRLADESILAARLAHDRWNSYVLPPLCAAILSSWFCAVAPYGVTVALAAYALADALYVLRAPLAVPLPRVILMHHGVTLAFLLVPLHHPDLAEFTAIAGAALRCRACSRALRAGLRAHVCRLPRACPVRLPAASGLFVCRLSRACPCAGCLGPTLSCGNP
jgi:hypothetical protein